VISNSAYARKECPLRRWRRRRRRRRRRRK
jgi:hypothetical protein